MRAVQGQSQGGQSALAELCRLYWYPLYVFARHSGHSPDDAQDLIQGFFLHLLEHRVPTGVDRLKGKFRSFLLASLQNYLSDELDRARCLKRGGNEEFVHLDSEDAEERYRFEPVEFLTTEKIFDARWAMTVLGEAMNQLRQEYATEEKASTFETLKVFLDPINSIAPPSYEEVAHQLQVSMGGVKTLIHRLRKQYTALLREEVGRTVCDPVEIDEEIHALCEALVASEGRLGSMKMEDRRTCSVCGTEFSANMEFCPVCVLRRGLDEPPESDESSLEKASVESSPALPAHRFEHYELVKGEDGKPIELGRGAMGVTYKAFDVDLHCPVTLKVISEKYLGEESARLRFLREARAAASIRHPNVASVFHLGRSGQDYFYAMEFVEGETLENLIKRSGRLEVKLALEIVTQTAAGLAAVHKRNLVHRDIKPSNIMVSVEEGSTVTAKIIDLGLAKPAPDAPAAAAISTPGAFAGTPEFASPEQFAGIQVDIRSDLYSLGVTLWEMVTGQAPFQGSPAEVMYQHQHASLPLDRLKRVSQPVVVLLEVFLEKDPGRRFQNPAELLKAMPTITGAIDAGRRITRKSLQEMPPAASPVVTRKPPTRFGQFVSFILGRANVSPAKPVEVFAIDQISKSNDALEIDHANATQTIKYCRAPDGVRIAYAISGSGPPLVKAGNWMNHLEYDWESPIWSHFFRGLSREHTLIRYDARGNGMSDWDVDRLSLDAWVTDLETVIDVVGIERFPLLGISQGGAVAVTYAVRHPERVSHLILYGGFALGGKKRSPAEKEKRDAMTTLMRLGWGANNPSFRQIFTSLFIPGGTHEQADYFNELCLKTTSPECAARYFDVVGDLDVTDLLSKVKAPTLVMHVRDDVITPLEAGRQLAAGIPGARFIVFPGRNHMFLEHEPASNRFFEEISLFLSSRRSEA
jgi:RNA polymerase sigma factor (sigma-70 family)